LQLKAPKIPVLPGSSSRNHCRDVEYLDADQFQLIRLIYKYTAHPFKKMLQAERKENFTPLLVLRPARSVAAPTTKFEENNKMKLEAIAIFINASDRH
jgi:hypothetical protein